MIHFFINMPMSPSLNHAYKTVGNRRIKSQELCSYQAEMMRWGLTRIKELRKIRALIELSENKKLRLELIFFFPQEKLYTKSGNVKKLDVSNRIKAIEDAFFKLIDIDDRFVFQVVAEKRQAETEKISLQIHFHDF